MRIAALSIFSFRRGLRRDRDLAGDFERGRPGGLVPVELQLATPDIVGGFEFVVNADH